MSWVADRTALYDLGLADGDIDDTPTTELAARILEATTRRDGLMTRRHQGLRSTAS